MIKNSAYYELFASYTVPDPNRVGYWVDLGANSKGKVIKTYNENLKKWVKVTDATSEDAVAPFIGNNGNWWIDNRDTGIFASGRPPFIGNNDNWFTYDSSGNPVDTGKSSKGAPGLQGPAGVKGDKGETGPAGKDATINGLTTINIVEGDNISITQTGNTLTISGNGGLSDETDPIFSASPAAKITDTNLSNWSNKQDKLVSGTNIKTINGTPILGGGDIIIEPSSPFVNQEYADIVVNAINNNSISSDDYNKLSSWAVPVDNFYPYAETLFQGAVARMSIFTEDDVIYVYMHMTQTLTSSPLHTGFALIEIKEDLTLTIKDESGIALKSSGDGTRFLANDGTYKPVDLSNVVTEAPSDDVVYGRKNGEWTEVEASPYSSIIAGDHINIDETDEGVKLSVADGKGSGLDADKLDGIDSYYYKPMHRLGVVSDYHQYIIALHPIEGGKQDYCFSNGEIHLNRFNGLKSYGPCTIFYNSHKIYNTSNAEGAIFRIGEFSALEYRYPTFCTFTYESLKWIGIQILPDSAQLDADAKISGQWTHTPFLIDYYNSKTAEILNEEVYNSLVIEGDDIIKRNLYNFGDKILTTADINAEDLITYGVKWEVDSTNPVLTRIGNVTLHQSLPIQSKMRGCTLADDGTVNHYFNNDWTANEDGTAIVKDGSDGMVMIEIPEHYVKYEVVDGYNTIRISEVYISGYTKVDKQYISAYEATIDRTDITTPKLASVVNLSAEFRGGNNNAEWDSGENTLLGKPSTYTSRANFRTYARNRGNENEYYWNMYDFIAHNTLYTLYIVEYANLNSQLAVNNTLTSNGYKQGGLGDGITNLNGSAWNKFNSYNPVAPCGYSDSLGNNSGEVAYTMPASYGTLTTYVNRYRGVENPFGHIWKNTDGIIFDIKTDADGGTSTIYIATNPEKYKDSVDEGYNAIGELPRTAGYVKSLHLGTFFPSAIGGSSTTGLCDYFYTDISGSSLRTCFMGGNAHDEALAGFAYVDSSAKVGTAHAKFGSRLIFRKQ